MDLIKVGVRGSNPFECAIEGTDAFARVQANGSQCRYDRIEVGATVGPACQEGVSLVLTAFSRSGIDGLLPSNKRSASCFPLAWVTILKGIGYQLKCIV